MAQCFAMEYPNLNKISQNHAVTAPSHYTRFKLQPMWVAAMNNLSNWQYQIMKYTWRWDGKNGLEDLKKALVWLVAQILFVEKGIHYTPNQFEVIIRVKRTKGNV